MIIRAQTISRNGADQCARGISLVPHWELHCVRRVRLLLRLRHTCRCRLMLAFVFIIRLALVGCQHEPDFWLALYRRFTDVFRILLKCFKMLADVPEFIFHVFLEFCFFLVFVSHPKSVARHTHTILILLHDSSMLLMRQEHFWMVWNWYIIIELISLLFSPL